MSRQAPHDISGYPFDLIVVGAGINDAGIARDSLESPWAGSKASRGSRPISG